MFGDLSQNTKSYPVKKLSDIADYWNGLTYKPADTVESGAGTLVLRSSNIQNGELAFDDNVFVSCTIKEKLYVQDNDILMCSRNGSAALVGKTALIKGLKEPTTFGAFMMIIRSKYYPYLKTYFELPFFRNQISTGTSTINQITGKMLNDIQLPVPDTDTVSEFENFVHQSDKSKFTGFKSQFIELFGKLPEEFKHDTVALGDIADMLSGGTPSSKHPEYYGGSYPFVTTPCLGKNYIDSSDAVNWLSEIGVEKSSTHIIPAYSIMYGSRVGVGKSSINTCDMCTNQDILSFFNIDTSKYDLLFIKKVMDQYFDYVDAQKRGSTIKGVPSDVVKSIRIPVVAIEEQKSFAAFTEQSDKSK